MKYGQFTPLRTYARLQIADISRIGRSVMRMDDMIRENAALTEEASAASAALQEQAEKLVQAVSVFKLRGSLSRPAPLEAEAVDGAEALPGRVRHATALRVISGRSRALPLDR